MTDFARLSVVNLGIAGVGLALLLALGVPQCRSWLPSLLALAPITGLAFVGIATTFGAMVGIDVGLGSAAALTSLLGAVTWLFTRRSWGVGAVAPRGAGLYGRLVETGFLLLLAFLSFAIVRFAVATPLDAWDGWAIWGAKANALYSEGDVWSPVFTEPEYVMQHQEYPVLMPSLAALSADVLGRFEPHLIDVEAAVVLVAYGMAVWGVLRLVVLPAVAAAVAFALTGSAPLVINAGANYSDAVVASFTALGLLVLLVWISRGGMVWLALGSLFFAAAVSTKSEGVLFAVAAILSALVLAPRFGQSRRLVAGFALASLLPAVAWSVIDRLNGAGADNVELGRLLEPGVLAARVEASVNALVGELATNWTLAMMALAVVLIAGAIARSWRGAAFILLWLGLSLGALVAVYAFSTNPIEWHLATSADRVVFSIALGVATVAPILVALALEAAGLIRATHEARQVLSP